VNESEGRKDTRRCARAVAVERGDIAGPRQADVAIVGAALGGLVAGAILTRHGKRVVIFDEADAVGGRGGAIEHRGYWIDFAHREGHDVGDCQIAWHYGAEAAREAGVEITLRPIAVPLRLHRFPDGDVAEGRWGAEGFLRAARDFFECPDDGLAELTSVLGDFAAASSERVTAAIPERLGPWVEEKVRHAAVRRSLLLMAKVIFHRHPEEASVGRFMDFFRTPKAGPFMADDAEAGAQQGLMEPWARAIRARGGTIALGWKPVEIVVEEGRARGVVAVDRANLVWHVEAPVVISTYPVWELFDLADERRFDARFVATAREIREHRADLVGWVAGLARLPTIRSTGLVEHHAGWNRLLRGAERAYRGGYHIPSMTSRRAAPEGKHVLELVMARWFRGGSTAGQTWTEAQSEIDEAIEYLGRFYRDFESLIEWSRYVYGAAPQTMSWYWAPVHRHPLEAPGVVDLLLATSTLEAQAAVVDIGAYAGLMAARRALERLG
jgi:phytoene dehydrogenase-like protein